MTCRISPASGPSPAFSHNGCHNPAENKRHIGYPAVGRQNVGPDSRNVINALIAAAIAFAVTFVTQWRLGFEDV